MQHHPTWFFIKGQNEVKCQCDKCKWIVLGPGNLWNGMLTSQPPQPSSEPQIVWNSTNAEVCTK